MLMRTKKTRASDMPMLAVGAREGKRMWRETHDEKESKKERKKERKRMYNPAPWPPAQHHVKLQLPHTVSS